MVEVNETEKIKVQELEGRIIKINKEKGYGFLISNQMRFTKFFFHWTTVVARVKPFTELEVGSKVMFTPMNTDPKSEDRRGPRAINVKAI